MKAHKLAQKLLQYPNHEIMILDGFNGQGYPRAINCGPFLHEITDVDQNETADCEELNHGQVVIVMGYGCY